MTLDTIQTPTPSIMKVLTALSRHARANPSEDLVVINAATTPEARAGLGALALARHLEWHGLEADLDLHSQFLRNEGWTRFVSDGMPWWLVRSDMPHWIAAHYLLPRCLSCATSNYFECRCEDLTAVGKKRRHEYGYVLELETPNHFYVGRTTHPEKRMEHHIAGKGTEWTSLHKPVRLLAMERVHRQGAQAIEDQTTLDLMAVFGATVRGGYYVSDDQVRKVLPTTTLITRKRGPSLAPADPSIWARRPAEGEPAPSLWSGLPCRWR